MSTSCRHWPTWQRSGCFTSTVRRAEVLTEQLRNALNSRVLIAQAKGALAQFRDVSLDEAFELMRRYARAHHLRLGQVAEAVLDKPASLPQLTVLGPRSAPST